MAETRRSIEQRAERETWDREEFVSVWNRSDCASQVARRLGLSTSDVHYRVMRLRTEGVDLPRLIPQKRDTPDREELDEVREEFLRWREATAR